MGAARVRRASRVLLVDPAGRVLLMRADGWWFTVGGGIEPGETGLDAAVREVSEETGFRLSAGDLTPVLHRRRAFVTWGDELIDAREEFRAARVPGDAVDTSGFTPLERSVVQEFRWWSEAELRATEENVAPDGLADLLAAAAR